MEIDRFEMPGHVSAVHNKTKLTIDFKRVWN